MSMTYYFEEFLVSTFISQKDQKPNILHSFAFIMFLATKIIFQVTPSAIEHKTKIDGNEK